MKYSIEKRMKDALAKKHPCYVLITCNDPSEDGTMQVEMSYKGDPVLAAYMLQGAQLQIDEEFGDNFEEENEKITQLSL